MQSHLIRTIPRPLSACLCRAMSASADRAKRIQVAEELHKLRAVRVISRQTKLTMLHATETKSGETLCDPEKKAAINNSSTVSLTGKCKC